MSTFDQARPAHQVPRRRAESAQSVGRECCPVEVLGDQVLARPAGIQIWIAYQVREIDPRPLKDRSVPERDAERRTALQREQAGDSQPPITLRTSAVALLELGKRPDIGRHEPVREVEVGNAAIGLQARRNNGTALASSPESVEAMSMDFDHA